MLKCFFSIGMSLLLALVAFENAAAVQESKQTTLVKEPADDKNVREYKDRAAESAKVLTEIMNIFENFISEELMARAHGIAVILYVVKGAFGLGGQWGKGLMSQRGEDGSWSTLAFVEIGGGSFGLQIGVQVSDVVLVFTDESGIKGFLKSKLKLGADASVTVGSVG